jgi:hypothetical protein
LDKAIGPLFGMSKAQICIFATAMGVGAPPRAIPHASLTEFDLRTADPELQSVFGLAPLHDSYGEESNADTDIQDALDFPHQVIELNEVEDSAEVLEVAA